ncbi:MAG TPA: MFS transporter [Pseudonocardiaceae bacterium]|nr:MFS transporter [Pseudonocardiaceae bacterium]
MATTVRRFLINRTFARLWAGQAVSTVGDYIFDTTLVLWVATVLAGGQPWAPAAVSGIMLSVGAAVLVVGPAAGVFVDRWNRRTTMLHSEVIRAILAGALTVLSFLSPHALPIWLWLVAIYLVVFVLNSAGQFFGPARFAIIADVVEGTEDRARAAGVSQATVAAAGIIGPPLAAPLLFTVGIQWALLFNTLSYVASYLLIRSIRPTVGDVPAQTAPSAGLRAEFVAGLRFFAGNRFLVAILVTAVIAAFGSGALNALDVFFVTQNLHTPSKFYGFISTAQGIGAIIGGLGAAWVISRFTARRTVWLAILVGGVLIVAYSRATSFPVALVAIFLVVIPIAMVNTGLTPLLLASTPPEFLGRVIAVFGPVTQAASMLSVVIGGWLASTVLRGFHGTIGGVRFGAIDTIFLCTGLLIVAAGVYASFALPPEPAPPVV